MGGQRIPTFGAIITRLCDWVKSLILISQAAFIAKTHVFTIFLVDNPVDKFGDNWDNSPILVDKWGKNDVMSCCILDLRMRIIETYPHIHREYSPLAN